MRSTISHPVLPGLLLAGALGLGHVAAGADPSAAGQPAGPDTLTPAETMPRTAPIAPGFSSEGKAATREPPRVAAADRTFLVDAARLNWSEVRAANLAVDKTKNDAVKQFAFMLATDHGRNTDELEGLAKSRLLDLGKPDPARTKKIDALQKQSASGYDAAFLDLMIATHREAMDLYRKGAGASTDAEVKEYAERSLGDLQKHLAAAEHLRGTLRGGQAAKGS